MRSISLRQHVESAIREMAPAAESFSAREKLQYADWLAQTYYFVCHSTRLLALACSRFGQDRHELHLRFMEHTREERNHEMLALRDLSHLGLNLERFPEHPETQAFYQTQYYWIEHRDPIAFFGYALCLEAFAISGGKRIYSEARRTHGEGATTFLKVHVQEDESHVEEAFKSLERLSDGDQRLILENLRLSSHLYAQIYRRITAAEGRATVRIAA